MSSEKSELDPHDPKQKKADSFPVEVSSHLANPQKFPLGDLCVFKSDYVSPLAKPNSAETSSGCNADSLSPSQAELLVHATDSSETESFIIECTSVYGLDDDN